VSISGKYMETKIGDVSPVFVAGNYGWTVEESADDLDGTTGEDDGYANHYDGVWDAVVNLKGYMDVAAGEYTPVRRGTTISNLKLYRDKDDATPAFTFPSCLVLNSTQGGEVRGKIEWTARIVLKGTYTYADPA
jgi:hypothetical protein